MFPRSIGVSGNRSPFNRCATLRSVAASTILHSFENGIRTRKTLPVHCSSSVSRGGLARTLDGRTFTASGALRGFSGLARSSVAFERNPSVTLSARLPGSRTTLRIRATNGGSRSDRENSNRKHNRSKVRANTDGGARRGPLYSLPTVTARGQSARGSFPRRLGAQIRNAVARAARRRVSLAVTFELGGLCLTAMRIGREKGYSADHWRPSSRNDARGTVVGQGGWMRANVDEFDRPVTRRHESTPFRPGDFELYAIFFFSRPPFSSSVPTAVRREKPRSSMLRRRESLRTRFAKPWTAPIETRDRIVKKLTSFIRESDSRCRFSLSNSIFARRANSSARLPERNESQNRRIFDF